MTRVRFLIYLLGAIVSIPACFFPWMIFESPGDFGPMRVPGIWLIGNGSEIVDCGGLVVVLLTPAVILLDLLTSRRKDPPKALIASAAATLAVAAAFVVGTLRSHQHARPEVFSVFPVVDLVWIGPLLVLSAALWGWFFPLRSRNSDVSTEAGDAVARRGIHGWDFLLQWLVASAAGMTLGVTLGASGRNVFADLIYQLWPKNLPLGTLFYLRESLHLIPFALALGASVGFMQWLVLRRYLLRSSGWVWASSLGWPLGWSLSRFAVEQWNISARGFQSPESLYFFSRTDPTGLFAAAGAVVGAFLFFLYRSQIRRFGSWIVACAAGAAAAGWVWHAVPSYINAEMLQTPYQPGTAFLSGLAFGAVTGICLWPLFRLSRRKPAKDGP